MRMGFTLSSKFDAGVVFGEVWTRRSDESGIMSEIFGRNNRDLEFILENRTLVLRDKFLEVVPVFINTACLVALFSVM